MVKYRIANVRAYAEETPHRTHTEENVIITVDHSRYRVNGSSVAHCTVPNVFQKNPIIQLLSYNVIPPSTSPKALCLTKSS